jgi:hypothetical protein
MPITDPQDLSGLANQVIFFAIAPTSLLVLSSPAPSRSSLTARKADTSCAKSIGHLVCYSLSVSKLTLYSRNYRLQRNIGVMNFDDESVQYALFSVDST